MKKVLLVTRVSGFIPQHEMNDVKILKDMGYEVHYATDLNNVVYGKDNERLKGTGIITHQIDFVKSPLSKKVKVSVRQLEKLIEQEKFDLIHCHMPMSAVVTRRAAENVRKKTGKLIPVIYTAHGLHFYSKAPLKNWIFYPVERHYARYTDRLILINEEDYRRGKKFPIRGKVSYVPGVGIDLDKYTCPKKGTDIIEKIIGKKISEDTKVVVSVGELSKRKNQQLIVEMMKELKDLNLICIIAGTGDQMEHLRNQIAYYGLENKVFLPGYVENVRELLWNADCFVFPSHQEGLPVAIMEAMAAGLPVVASEIRGVTDLIEHGKGGYLVRGFHPIDYSVKVRRLFTEKYGKSAVPRDKRRKGMGDWNRERIKKFSVKIVEEKMREIYKEMADYN